MTTEIKKATPWWKRLTIAVLVFGSFTCFMFLDAQRSLLPQTQLGYEIALPFIDPIDVGGIESLFFALLKAVFQQLLPFL